MDELLMPIPDWPKTAENAWLRLVAVSQLPAAELERYVHLRAEMGYRR